jgi:leucyl aminopeptidase
MIKYIHKHSDISYKNIVTYIESEKELSVLDFLKLDINILKDIKKSLKAKKSSFKEYFIGSKTCEKIHIFISKEKEYEKKVNFLGKSLPKLFKELTLISNNSEAQKLLLEVSQLSRYSFQDYKTKKKIIKTQVFCSIEEKKDLQNLEKKLDNICLARNL